ncbi:hypothetical protein [Leptospira gomenensis]|nr:hypothetical protein [Leptospira gomenensis]
MSKETKSYGEIRDLDVESIKSIPKAKIKLSDQAGRKYRISV